VELILVRHAQPDWSPGRRVSNDPTLTPLGSTQAGLLTTRGWGRVDAVWVSPMRRALDTVRPLAAHLGMEPVVHPWLAEIQPASEWEGSPLDELEEVFRTANLRTVEELWEGMPGAESFRDFHRRVSTGMDATLAGLGLSRLDGPHLWQGDADVRVVVVAHGGTNAVVLGHLLGVETTPWEWDRFDSAHTAVATVTTRPIAHGTAFGMTGFGDTHHLPPEMVTR
jgi:probable phosphoglycerate mutase